MKPILGLAASAALALAPLSGVAQESEDETTERLNAQQLPTDEVQGSNNGEVVPISQGAELPVLSTVPSGAVIVGGMVILAGVVIGIAASGDSSSSTTTTTN